MNTRAVSAVLGVALSIVSACSTAQAQFSVTNVSPAFFAAPSSGVGTISGNTLVLTPNTNGFTVSGQVLVTVPSGSFSGVLAQWTVIRRLDPALSWTNLTTTGNIIGFSTPPAGAFANSSGSLTTDVRFNAGPGGFVGGSQNVIGLSLVNGIDSPSWGGTGLTATSGTFVHTTVFFPNSVLQQTFTINANQTSGPGGVWVIDVPVTASLDDGNVPAPGTLVMLSAGMFVVGVRPRRRA